VNFKPEVIADTSNKWCGNALRFAMRVPVESDHGFRWKMIAQSGGT
jgi:hypothetical protein